MRPLFKIVRFLGRYPGSVVLCLVLLLLTIACEMALPQVMRRAINALKAWNDHKVLFDPWSYAKVFFAIGLLRELIRFWNGRVRNRLIQQTLVDIRSSIYEALQRLAFSFHDKNHTGELISRSTSDVWRLQEFLVACLLLSVDIMVAIIVTTVLIFMTNKQLGWVAVGTFGPTILLITYYSMKLQPKWRLAHDLQAEMMTTIQENIAGIRVVKAFAKEGDEITKFDARQHTYKSHLMKTVDYWTSRVPFTQFIFGLTIPIVLWIGGREVIAGTLELGDLSSVIFYVMSLGYRMEAVGRFANIIQNASASAERVLEIIEDPERIKSGKLRLPAGGGRVELKNVSFNYSPGKVALENISFKVEPGQTVAVVGPTGSGKSTLVHLIPRFYDPPSGRIMVEGVDVRELKLDELRRSVSVIFQETFLFSTTIARNIAYGRPKASQADIERCAKAAQAHEFISELEEGYNTVIGERGVSLSGGQKQRLSIARAFLVDPRILIFDDATASVDARTERLIQEAMRRLAVGRTTFIIAHRCSTVQHADLILVLEGGRIVQRGTHAGLIDQPGLYQTIFSTELEQT